MPGRARTGCRGRLSTRCRCGSIPARRAWPVRWRRCRPSWRPCWRTSTRRWRWRSRPAEWRGLRRYSPRCSITAPAPADPAQVCTLLYTDAASLVTALEEDPAIPLRAVQVLTGAERERVLAGWNDTTAPVPAGTIPGLVRAQAALTPDAVAVSDGQVQVSYWQLNARANRLGRLLARAGAGPERVVAVMLERSAELVVALLAVLRTGAAYLPVDPGFPAERIAFMLADADSAVILASAATAAAGAEPVTASVLALDEPAVAVRLAEAGAGDLADGDREAAPRAGHPAYVLYTSGSTGLPKAVVMGHAAVLNRLAWMQGLGRL